MMFAVECAESPSPIGKEPGALAKTPIGAGAGAVTVETGSKLSVTVLDELQSLKVVPLTEPGLTIGASQPPSVDVAERSCSKGAPTLSNLEHAISCGDDLFHRLRRSPTVK
jgi:hypothetical protein